MNMELLKAALDIAKVGKMQTDDVVSVFDLLSRIAANRADLRQRMQQTRQNIELLDKQWRELSEAASKGHIECPCPSPMVQFHGDPAGGRDSYHECMLCGKTW